MEGEEDDSDDERALGRQVWWKRLIIFAAGAFMNFLTGFLIILCLYAGAGGFYTSEIVALNPDFPQQGEDGLVPGDVIYAINGERIYLKSDVSLIMGLGDTGTIDMTVLRGGEKLDRTLTKQTYTDVHYEDVCYIMFGKESAGIPEEILLNYKETAVRIPMFDEIRSLNLGNSVAIILYEALRQQEFKELQLEGQLHHYEW